MHHDRLMGSLVAEHPAGVLGRLYPLSIRPESATRDPKSYRHAGPGGGIPGPLGRPPGGRLGTPRGNRTAVITTPFRHHPLWDARLGAVWARLGAIAPP